MMRLPSTTLVAFGIAGLLTACGGYFRPIPPPVAFSANDAPPGHGWFCAVRGDGSFCERDMLVCARKQAATPGTSACVEWANPAFCYSSMSSATRRRSIARDARTLGAVRDRPTSTAST